MCALKVSVIIPAYNRAAYLPDTLQSVFAQTCQPFEIIVVDDGSTDNSAEVLTRYGSTIKVIRQENKGVATARNTGIHNALGNALMFLDSDDLLAPNCIERLSAKLEQTPEAAVIYCDAVFIDQHKHELGRFSHFYPVHRPSGYIFAEMALHSIFPVHAAIVRRSSLGSLWFNEDRGIAGTEDFDLWLRLSAKANFVYLDEALVYYRIHPSSTVQSAAPNTMAKREVRVQSQVFSMPEFERLTPTEQARIHTSHGVKHAMIGNLYEARRSFATAWRLRPIYAQAAVLYLSSWLGLGLSQWIINLRRKVAGVTVLSEIQHVTPNKSK